VTILTQLIEESSWITKQEIIDRTKLQKNLWKDAIGELITLGLVDRIGRGRGVRYRATNKPFKATKKEI